MINSISTWLSSRKLFIAILLAVAVALLLTCCSLWIYHSNDVSRLDISRPGYEKARQSVKRNEDNTKFSATGVLDKAALDQFDSLFTKARNDLNGNGKFDGNVLDDDQLKIAPAQ